MNTKFETHSLLLSSEIDRLLTEMSDKDGDSDEYRKMVDQLIKLYKLKELEDSAALKGREVQINADKLMFDQAHKRQELEHEDAKLNFETNIKQQELELKKRVSKETLATIAGNIAGILIIVGYERVNVVTTKAIGMLFKR